MNSKFAIITDAHMGPIPYYGNCNRLMAGESSRVLPLLVNEINGEPGVEFVVQLGDLIQEDIQNPSQTQDAENLQQALGILSKFKMPIFHTVGNHCQATLTPDQLKEAFGYSSLFYSFETQELHNIVLYSTAPGHRDMVIPEEEVAWLANELEKARKPVIIYLHHQLVEHSLEQSFWFKGTPEKAFVKNAAEIRDLIANSGKVLAVFNGHMHNNNYLVDRGVAYITIQSMIEDSKMIGQPCEAYALVTIDSSQLAVDIRGYEPVTYRHPFTRSPACAEAA